MTRVPLDDLTLLFRRLLDMSREINQIHDRASILGTLCRTAAAILGANHSGIVVFNKDCSEGTVVAEYPVEFGALATNVISTGDSPAEQKLIYEQEILHYPDLATETSRGQWGRVHEILTGRGIRSILVVPIVNRGSVIGSFSLDQTDRIREFSTAEITIAELLSSIAAGAIERAKRMEDSGRWSELLGSAATELDEVVQHEDAENYVVGLALKLIGGARASFCRWIQKRRKFLRVACMPAEAASFSPAAGDESLAERTLDSLDDFLILKPEGPGHGALLGVTIGGQSGTYGVIVVEGHAGEHFSDEQVRSLRIFGQYARHSLASADELRRLKFWQELADKTSTTVDPSDALQILVKHTCKYFTAAFCRAILWDVDRNLWFDSVWPDDAIDPINANGEHNTLHMLQTLDDLGTVERECTSEDPQFGILLRSLSSEIGLVQPAQWAILRAVRHEKRTVGWFIVAAPSRDSMVALQDETPGMVANIAVRISITLARLRWQDVSRRRTTLLAAFHRVSSELIEDMSQSELAREIPRLGATMLGASAAGLFEALSDAGNLKLIGSWPDGSLAPFDPLPFGPAARKLLSRGRSWAATEMSVWQPLLKRYSTLAVAPLRIGGPDFNHLLVVAFSERRELLPEAELDVLNSFAARGSAVLSHAVLAKKDQTDSGRRTLAHIQTLYELTRFSLAERDPGRVLRAVLTGITALYGLRINRAAVLLVKQTGTEIELIGEEAIGDLDLSTAEENWDAFRSSDLTTFEQYLAALSQGLPNETTLQTAMSSLRVLANDGSSPKFTNLVMNDRPDLLEANDLPTPLREHYCPGNVPIAAIPLRTSEGTTEGLLLADNKHTKVPIGPQEMDLLLKFAVVAAEALGRWRRQGTGADWGVPDVAIDAPPAEILTQMLDALRRPYPGSGAGVILIDEKNRPRNLFTRGMERPKDFATWMRPEGHSLKAIKTGRPSFLEDRKVDPNHNTYISVEMFPSSVCVPFMNQHRIQGIVWLYFAERLSRTEFEKEKLPTMQALVNRYTAAYVTALRLTRRAGLIRLTEEVAQEFVP